jgi:hypothetical protein
MRLAAAGAICLWLVLAASASARPRAAPEIGYTRLLADVAGNAVVLDDRSIWRVAPIDAVSAGSWPLGDRITVTRSTNARYPYRLTDRDRGQTVLARFLAVG